MQLTDIEKVSALYSEFFDREYDVEIAIWLERDQSKLLEKEAQASSFLASGIQLLPHRSTSDVNEFLDKGIEQASLRQRRTVFQIKSYLHLDKEIIYRCYVSSTVRGDNTYYDNFYGCKIQNEFKIISRYAILDESMDLDSDDSCWLSVGNLWWKWVEGYKFETLGSLLKIKKFKTPNSFPHLQEYEAE
jgi:hypothetical protein